MFPRVLSHLPDIENQAVLTEYGEDCEEASKHPDISGLEIGSRGGGVPGATEHGDEGEESGDAESHPAGDMFSRDEEGEPGDEDKHAGRNKGLSHVKREATLKLKTNFKPRLWRLPQMNVGVV